MGRLRDGPAEVPRPGSAPLEDTGGMLLNLASEQQRGATYVGQCVLEPAARVARAPTLLPYVQHFGPAPPGNVPPFLYSDFAVEVPDPTLLALPIPQMPRMLSSVRSSGTGLNSAVKRSSTPSGGGGGARTRGSTPATPGGSATTPSPRPFDNSAVYELRNRGLTWEAIARQLPGGWTAAQVRQRYMSTARNSSTGGGPEASGGVGRWTTPRRTSARIQQAPAAAGGGEAGLDKDDEEEEQEETKEEGGEARGSRGAAPAKRRRLSGAADVARGGLHGAGRRSSGGGGEWRRESDGGGQSVTPPPQLGSATAGGAAADGGKLAPPPAAAGLERLRQQVNRSFTNRRGGDRRVKLRGLLPEAPRGCTVAEAHQLSSLSGVKFYSQVEVEDPEESGVWYVFSLDDPMHCACFFLGQGKDGSAVISWSDFSALYELPDGTRWAEHGYFHDADDLAELMRPGQLQTLNLGQRELVRRAGRHHSRLHDIELECWVYPQQVPADCPHDLGNTFFWRHVFDPHRGQLLSPSGRDAASVLAASSEPGADGAEGLQPRSQSADTCTPEVGSVAEAGIQPLGSTLVGAAGEPVDTEVDLGEDVEKKRDDLQGGQNQGTRRGSAATAARKHSAAVEVEQSAVAATPQNGG